MGANAADSHRSAALPMNRRLIAGLDVPTGLEAALPEEFADPHISVTDAAIDGPQPQGTPERLQLAARDLDALEWLGAMPKKGPKSRRDHQSKGTRMREKGEGEAAFYAGISRSFPAAACEAAPRN